MEKKQKTKQLETTPWGVVRKEVQLLHDVPIPLLAQIMDSLSLIDMNKLHETSHEWENLPLSKLLNEQKMIIPYRPTTLQLDRSGLPMFQNISKFCEWIQPVSHQLHTLTVQFCNAELFPLKGESKSDKKIRDLFKMPWEILLNCLGSNLQTMTFHSFTDQPRYIPWCDMLRNVQTFQVYEHHFYRDVPFNFPLSSWKQFAKRTTPLTRLILHNSGGLASDPDSIVNAGDLFLSLQQWPEQNRPIHLELPWFVLTRKQVAAFADTFQNLQTLRLGLTRQSPKTTKLVSNLFQSLPETLTDLQLVLGEETLYPAFQSRPEGEGGKRFRKVSKLPVLSESLAHLKHLKVLGIWGQRFALTSRCVQHLQTLKLERIAIFFDYSKTQSDLKVVDLAQFDSVWPTLREFRMYPVTDQKMERFCQRHPLLSFFPAPFELSSRSVQNPLPLSPCTPFHFKLSHFKLSQDETKMDLSSDFESFEKRPKRIVNQHTRHVHADADWWIQQAVPTQNNYLHTLYLSNVLPTQKWWRFLSASLKMLIVESSMKVDCIQQVQAVCPDLRSFYCPSHRPVHIDELLGLLKDCSGLKMVRVGEIVEIDQHDDDYPKANALEKAGIQRIFQQQLNTSTPEICLVFAWERSYSDLYVYDPKTERLEQADDFVSPDQLTKAHECVLSSSRWMSAFILRTTQLSAIPDWHFTNSPTFPTYWYQFLTGKANTLG